MKREAGDGSGFVVAGHKLDFGTSRPYLLSWNVQDARGQGSFGGRKRRFGTNKLEMAVTGQQTDKNFERSC